MRFARAILLWGSLGAAVVVPVLAAALNPLLAWRDPTYIAAGFAGIVAMATLLFQPLLAAGILPGVSKYRSRRLHLWTGGILVAAVGAHVIGLWFTSPPDVIDALLFRSPTPFSYLGVIAMWTLFATAFLAVFRRWLALPVRTWRRVHTALALTIVAGSLAHALLIEGAMETVTKVVLCVLVAGATAMGVANRRAWTSPKAAR